MNNFSLEFQLQPSHTLFYPSSSSMDPTPFFYSLASPIHSDSDNSSSTNHHDSAPSRTETPSSADHRDPMFEKPLTPSDVGKLNRLVIPKQHAEKYFPLSAASSSAPDAGSGGLLLGFEDECGKCWRFRYSYWNSSQSYVLTKGWSRYVKEKKLDAGDVVLFERHRFEPDRFFIGWRRRGALTHPPPPTRVDFGGRSAVDKWSASSFHGLVHQGYPAPQPHRINGSLYPCLPADSSHAGTEIRHQNKKPAKSGSLNSKRLRLFGVNLECQLGEAHEDVEPQTSDGSTFSSQSQGPVQGLGSSVGPARYNYFEYMGYPSNHHNHMDMDFGQQMRNRLG